MRRADEDERSRLIGTLAAAPTGREDVRRELAALGFVLHEEADGTLVCRLPGSRGGSVEGAAVIVGAPASRASVLLEITRRTTAEEVPAGVELWFGSCDESRDEEAGLPAGTRTGIVLDHDGPIGELVLDGPTAYALKAIFHRRPNAYGAAPAQAGVAAGRAAAAMLDAPAVDVGVAVDVDGGVDDGRPAARVRATAQGRDAVAVEHALAGLVDRCYDAGNDPAHPCDVDMMVRREAPGYRVDPGLPVVGWATAALRGTGREARVVPSAKRSPIAERMQAQGIRCVRLGTGPVAGAHLLSEVAVALMKRAA